MMVLSVAVAKSAQTAGIKPERLVTKAGKALVRIIAQIGKLFAHTYCGKYHGFWQHAWGNGNTKKCFCS